MDAITTTKFMGLCSAPAPGRGLLVLPSGEDGNLAPAVAGCWNGDDEDNRIDRPQTMGAGSLGGKGTLATDAVGTYALRVAFPRCVNYKPPDAGWRISSEQRRTDKLLSNTAPAQTLQH